MQHNQAAIIAFNRQNVEQKLKYLTTLQGDAEQIHYEQTQENQELQQFTYKSLTPIPFSITCLDR